MLTFVIAAFCGIKDPNVSREKKEDCINYMSNCAIIQDGKTTEKRVTYCKEKWIQLYE